MKSYRFIILVFFVILLTIAGLFYYFLEFDTAYIQAAVAQKMEASIGRNVEMAGDLEVTFWFPAVVAIHDIRIENVDWGTWPEMGKVKRIEASLNPVSLLFGTIEFYKIDILAADLFLESSPDHGWNVDVLNASGAKSTDDPLPSVNRIRIENSVLHYRDGRSDHRYQVNLREATVGFGSSHKPLSLQVQGAFQKTPFSINGSLQPSTALFDSDQPLSLSARVEMKGNQFSVDGKFIRNRKTPVINADFEIHADRPSDLSRITEIPHVFTATPISASGHFEYTVDSVLRFTNLRAEMDRNHIAGEMRIEFNEGYPAIQADLHSSHLDLRAFFQGEPAQADGRANADPDTNRQRIFSDRPLNLDFFNGAAADIHLGIETLMLPDFAMKTASIKGKLEDGRLSIAPLTAVFGGGRIDGELQIAADGKTPSVDADIQIKKVELETLLSNLEASEAAKGVIGIDLNVQGRGNSVQEIMAGLNGQMVIIMQDGQIAAKYLKNAEKLNLDLTEKFLAIFDFVKKKKDFAEIHCFINKFVIEDGLADCKVLVFDTELVGIIGDGTINLKTEQLAISLSPINKGGLGVSGVGKIDTGINALPDHFDLEGTLSKPVITVDKSETAMSTLLTLGKAIGGTALLGPAGLAVALVNLDIGADNPCISALKKAAAEEAASENDQ